MGIFNGSTLLVILCCFCACAFSQTFEGVFTPPALSTGYRIVYGDNHFHALGRGSLGIISRDGVTWAPHWGEMYALAFRSDGSYAVAKDRADFADRVAVGNGTVLHYRMVWREVSGGGPPMPFPEYWKHDGKSSAQLNIFPTFYASEVLFADGFFYCLGGGDYEGKYGTRIFRADNSLTWTTVFETFESSGNGDERIKYTMGELTAVTTQSLLVSTNGVDWNATPLGLGHSPKWQFELRVDT